MFIGHYEHRLEGKGRVSVPKIFREEFKGECVVTRGLDGCLFLFAKESWLELVVKLRQIPLTKESGRQFVRLVTNNAFEIELDGLGRILIPETLRIFGGIKSEVIFAGTISRVEIWDKTRYLAHQEKLENKGTEIAEKLADLGI